MITRQRWIERPFTFNTDPHLYPNVIERLRGTPVRLEELVSRISPDLYTHEPEHGWSIQEIAGHLVDVEQLHDFRLGQFIAGEKTLMAPDMSGKHTSEAGWNDRSMAEVLAKFRAVREAFVARMEAVDDELVSRAAHHVRLNCPMRLIDMAVFAAEHDDNHLAEIVERLRAME